MQSITVQYLPATNHRPTRLNAKCAGGSITVPLDYSIDDRDYLVERTVALALIAKMGWGQDVRVTGAGRDYRGDVVFTLGNIETDNTSKRDRWIDQVRQSDIPSEYQEFLIRHHEHYTRPSMPTGTGGVVVLDELEVTNHE